MQTSYDELLSAAASLTATALLDDVESLPDAAARRFLAANCQALDLARTALGGECSGPVRPSVEFFSEQADTYGHVRNLARAWALQSRLARRDGDWTAAVQAGVDILNLSNGLRRGGLICDFLVADAVAAIGLESLRPLRRSLNGPRRSLLIPELDRIEREREALNAIVERDRSWEKAVGGEHGGFDVRGAMSPCDGTADGLTEQQRDAIAGALQSMLDLPDEALHQMHVELDRRGVAFLRLLVLDLALRSFRDDAGHYPPALAALAPSVLPFVPPDPFTGQPFRYRIGGDSFVLYSPGPTGIDHGGVFGPWIAVTSGQADYCLDAADFGAAVLEPTEAGGKISRILLKLHAALGEE